MARSLKKGQETWSSPRFKGPYAELVVPAKPVSWPLCVNHCHCSYPNFAGTRSEYLTPVGPAAFTQHLSLTLREPFLAFCEDWVGRQHLFQIPSPASAICFTSYYNLLTIPFLQLPEPAVPYPVRQSLPLVPNKEGQARVSSCSHSASPGPPPEACS